MLGIDPGLVRTGFGVIEIGPAGRHRVVQFGVLRPKANDPLERRLAAIVEGLRSVIAEHRPAYAAIEDVYHAKNAQSALLLGHARGAALVALAETGIAVAGYAPSTVKAHVSGNGLAQKAQVSFMVSRLLGLPGNLDPGDAADALALAICGADLARQRVASDATLRPRRRAAAKTERERGTGVRMPR